MVSFCPFQVHPEVAGCALSVKYRHLNFVSAPLVVLALVDEKLAIEERQDLGRKVAEVASVHWDDPMQITPIESPVQLQEEGFWQVHFNDNRVFCR